MNKTRMVWGGTVVRVTVLALFLMGPGGASAGPGEAGSSFPAGARTAAGAASDAPEPRARPGEAGSSLPSGAEGRSTADVYSYDPKGRRDPFRSMAHLIKLARASAELPPLQRFALSDLKLLGIVWGGYGYHGLIQTPDGKGYTVKQGTRMGTNHGTITSITAHRIVVSEPAIDFTGQKTAREVEILLRPTEGIP